MRSLIRARGRASRGVAIGLLLSAVMADAAIAQRAGVVTAPPLLPERETLPGFEDRLEREDETRPSLELPPLEALPEATPLAAPGGVAVRGFRIVGSTVFSEAELARVVAPFLERPLHSEDLPAITDALTRLYTDRGYITSGAIVPDQTLAEGIVEIRIVEGALGRLEITGSGRLRRSWIEPRLRAGLRAPLDVGEIERSLRLLQRDERVERVDAVLIPTQTLGESVLRLAIEEARPWVMDLRAANDIAPSLGGQRASAAVAHRNVLGFGDTLSATVSGARGLFALEVGYEIPVTPWLTQLGLRAEIDRGKVVEGDFADANFRNDFERYGIELSQPVVRSLENDLVLGVSFERERSKTVLGDSAFAPELADEGEPRIRLSLLRLKLEWVHRSEAQVLAAQLRTTFGLDLWDATSPNSTPATFDATLPDAEFTSALLLTQYARRFETPLGSTELLLRGDLQLASGSLFGIEAYSLGGVSTVRGYHETEIVTDNGALGTIEVRVPVLPPAWRPHALRIAPFVDVGYGWDDHDSRGPRFDRLLASVGFGFLYQYGARFQARLYWGKPLNQDSPRPGDELQDWGLHLEAIVAVF